METDVYVQVKSSIKRILKIDLENYKVEQMHRRLDSWLARSKVVTWKDYFQLISTDAMEFERFRNYLTINVTEFFRDQARWETLRLEILPYLMKNSTQNRSPRGLKIWSAGCSVGKEAYSLAMLMAELTSQYSLLATDMDRGALIQARAGGPYTQDEIRNLSDVQRKKYFSPTEPYFISEKLKTKIRFEEQDLFSEQFDHNFDLIVCRNVVIYFTAEAKDKLYEKFSDALAPGGVLFMGGTEIISGASKYGLQNFGVSFYKKTPKTG